MVLPQNFLGLLIIYYHLALQHCLQNPNTTFQYLDMSHQMTWYILAYIPYFRRPMASHYYIHFYSHSVPNIPILIILVAGDLIIINHWICDIAECYQ